MPHRVCPGSILLLLMFITLVVPTSVHAESSTSLFVLITYPDVDYTFGSTATVNIHVLDASEYVDPDRIELMAGARSVRSP